MDSIGRVVVARCVVKERVGSAGRVEVARGVAKERIGPLAVLKLPVVLLTSAFVPRLVLVCAAATPARESENMSATIRTEKNLADE